ncbi:TRAP transporter large permease subunit [Chloroflexota bacterium]
MEWWLILLLIFGILIVLMATGLPVAFCFMVINVVGTFLLWGGEAGLKQLSLGFFGTLATFTLLPLPLFVLMGEAMFHSGIGPRMMDALDSWLGRLPGRLSLLAVGGGTIFATLTGASMASVAMLGNVLVPDMEKRGYKKPMSLGPILGSGGLAIMIPPSGLAVLLGAIGQISIGKILVAIIVPGLVMATLYATYTIVRCQLQPSIAPPYVVTLPSLSKKLLATVQYILPLGVIVFLVIGVIILGIATPTEAAATGAIGCFLLAAFYRRLNWEVVKRAVSSATTITVMMFMIIAGALAFSQTMAFSGASRGLTQLAVGAPLPPIMIIIIMQVVLLFLGMFMNVAAIMMITLPIFTPVILNLGFDPVWFAVIFLLNIEMATTTPPFGMSLFVMKGVAPSDTTMGDIYRAALPFLGCDLIVMVLIIAFPMLALWLPSIMY